MIPTVTQQLQAMRRRLADTVLPALPADAGFAQEQAQLILATVDWLLDTHEHEYRYEVLENIEYRTMLAALLELDSSGAPSALHAEIRSGLAEHGPWSYEAATPLHELAEQTRRFKQLAGRAATDLLNGSEAQAEAARALLAQAARSQGERELAFYRMTGFSPEGEELRTVLDTQR